MEDEGLDDERISIRKAERKKEEETVILQGLEFEGNISATAFKLSNRANGTEQIVPRSQVAEISDGHWRNGSFYSERFRMPVWFKNRIEKENPRFFQNVTMIFRTMKKLSTSSNRG